MVFVSLSAHSTAEMLNKFVIIDRIAFKFVVPTIFMTPHLKQQERNNGVCGLGWCVCGVGVGSQIYLGGSRIFFQRYWCGGRQMFCPPHENVTPLSLPPPTVIEINYSSLT